MAGKKSVAGQVAAKYVADNPAMPSKTLARMMTNDEPKLFASISQAYNHVRYLRGNKGDAHRQVGDKTHFRPNGKAGEINLPVGLRQGKKPVQIDGPCKLLVLSDLHVPYHDETAIEAALRKGIDEDCDGLYLNGDTVDFYSISRWQQDPRQRNLKREVETAREVLLELARHFKRRWFKVGNHDERYELYLWNRAEDLADFEEFDLRALLKLDEHKFEYVASKQWALLGKLPVLHGHETPRGISSPVNPARGLWLKLASTALCGHSHRSSHHSETHSMTKEMVSCWSTGCMCDLSPEYDPLNKWNVGFAVVDVGHGGDFNVSNYKIVENRIYRA